jgi:quinol monooxygenase YgiN
MITAIATQQVIAGKEETLLGLMQELTANVLENEPGCAQFLYVQAQDEPLKYIVIEQYVDQNAVDLHHRTPYLQAFIPEMMRCLTGAPTVVTCTDAFHK